MVDETCCNYANWETFNVAVWLDNVETHYHMVQGFVEYAQTFDSRQDRLDHVSSAIRRYVGDGIGTDDPDLSLVDWTSIAQEKLDQYDLNGGDNG